MDCVGDEDTPRLKDSVLGREMEAVGDTVAVVVDERVVPAVADTLIDGVVETVVDGEGEYDIEDDSDREEVGL